MTDSFSKTVTESDGSVSQLWTAVGDLGVVLSGGLPVIKLGDIQLGSLYTAAGSVASYMAFTETEIIFTWRSLRIAVIGRTTDANGRTGYGAVQYSGGELYTLTADQRTEPARRTWTVETSVYNNQLVPVIATDTTSKFDNAYALSAAQEGSYVGKIELNGAKYYQAGGLAIAYKE